MQRLTKAMAAIMLMMTAICAVGCKSKNISSGGKNAHEYVDLGLPSGTLWATCNVGASKPEDYGNYYAWGETQTKDIYNWETYKYANDDDDKLTKYCNKSVYGDDGFTDNLTALQAGDDPATANRGSGWCTPTEAQWDELLASTTNQWITRNGVKGILFTSKKNGQSIFLPAAGNHWDSELSNTGSYGHYWSRSLDTDYPSGACGLYFDSDDCRMAILYFRDHGRSVRPVREKSKIVSSGRQDTHEYVDLDLPSGTLWATCNIGANKPEEYGNYYAWGETQTKDTYNWETYKYADGDWDKLTKYCSKSDYGDNGFTDNLTTLQTSDDPATANWGNGWHTPTKEQWEELLDNTTNLWTTQYGVLGRLFSARNGKTLFLPAAGYRFDSELYYVGSLGFYWSQSLYTEGPQHYAWILIFFDPDSCNVYDHSRCLGHSVRPVREK